MSATSTAASINPVASGAPRAMAQRGRDEGARARAPRTPRARTSLQRRGPSTSLRLVDDLEVVTGADAAGVVVAVRGEVDAHTAPRLAAALAQTAADQHPRVAIDLGACTFLGVAGLHVIASMAAAVAPSGQVLTLRAASASILRILDLTGIGQLVELEAASAGDR